MKNSIHSRFGKTLGAMRRHAEMLAALALAAALFCPEASAKFPPRAKQARSSPSGQREQAARTPRISEERADVMPTREGLRLRLMADQGNVNILTVRPGAGKVQVSYRVRIETDARTPHARELLRRYVLSVRSTSSGVQIAGEMPKEALRDGAASNAGADSPRISVAFEVSVPSTGCHDGAGWCLHDVVITHRPHDHETFDLADDYTDFANRPVTTEYLDPLLAPL